MAHVFSVDQLLQLAQQSSDEVPVASGHARVDGRSSSARPRRAICSSRALLRFAKNAKDKRSDGRYGNPKRRTCASRRHLPKVQNEAKLALFNARGTQRLKILLLTQR